MYGIKASSSQMKLLGMYKGYTAVRAGILNYLTSIMAILMQLHQNLNNFILICFESILSKGWETTQNLLHTEKKKYILTLS